MLKQSFNYFKTCAVITFSTGLFLHLSRAIMGADYFLEHILTPATDKVFSIPMFLAAVFAWLSIKQINYKKTWRKVAFIIMTIYMTISIPVHVKSWFTNDMKQIEAFPESYSYFILPVILTLLLFTLSLQKKAQAINS